MSRFSPKRIALYAVVLLYMAVSLPITAIFLKDEYVRFINYNRIAHLKGKLLGLNSVFCGDSIMAGGRSWSMRLTGLPFDSINLGSSSFTISQVQFQMGTAGQYSPQNLFILARTNDILGINESLDFNKFEKDYNKLLDAAADKAQRIFVTLVPYTSNAEHTSLITQANEIIIRLCDERKISVINLNDTIAPEGILLSEFTVDGVHFSPKANAVWLEKVEAALENFPG